MIYFHVFGSSGDVLPFITLSEKINSFGESSCVIGPKAFQQKSRGPYISIEPDFTPNEYSKDIFTPDKADIALREHVESFSESAQRDVRNILKPGDIYCFSALTPGGCLAAQELNIPSYFLMHSPSTWLESVEAFNTVSDSVPYRPRGIFTMFPENFCKADSRINFLIKQSVGVYEPRSSIRPGIGAILGSIGRDTIGFYKSIKSLGESVCLDLFYEGDYGYYTFHHGGINATLHCLSKGIRQVIVPFYWDQPNNARLASTHGASVIPAHIFSERFARYHFGRQTLVTPTKITPNNATTCALDLLLMLRSC